MARKTKATAASPDAALVLTSPPAKPERKAGEKAAPNVGKKRRHIRVRDTATTATLRTISDTIILDVNDILTKNERHKVIIVGRPKSMGGNGQRAAPIPSPAAEAYVKAVTAARIAANFACLNTGRYRLEIVAVWPTERHHDDGTDTAHGDSDAPIGMVKDAMQRAGIIDDDMRFVGETTHAVYEKGVRRTVAVLRPITAEAHAASVAAVLGVLG